MGYTSNSKVAAAVLTKRQRLPWHTFMWHHPSQLSTGRCCTSAEVADLKWSAVAYIASFEKDVGLNF